MALLLQNRMIKFGPNSAKAAQLQQQHKCKRQFACALEYGKPIFVDAFGFCTVYLVPEKHPLFLKFVAVVNKIGKLHIQPSSNYWLQHSLTTHLVLLASRPLISALAVVHRL